VGGKWAGQKAPGAGLRLRVSVMITPNGFLPRLRDRSELNWPSVETNRALIESTRDGSISVPICSLPAWTICFARQSAVGATFTSTFEHRAVVERCAKEHVDVMMEKPLAVNMKHARAIEAAARRGNIQVFVNYETTWYAGNRAAYEMVHDRKESGTPQDCGA